MTWVRGGRRQTQDAAFQVDNIMDVAGGVSMAGLGIYTYHHQLTVEEGGLEKVIYLHLREPPAFKNKVDVFVLKEVTAHMEGSFRLGSPLFHARVFQAGSARAGLPSIGNTHVATLVGSGRRPTMVPLRSTT